MGGGDILQPTPSAGSAPPTTTTQSNKVQESELMSDIKVLFTVFLCQHTEGPLLTQSAAKESVWSGAGLNIDVDNLLTSPTKSAPTSSAPSMNQMVQGTSVSPSIPPPSSASFTAGPNYNVNTASLMGPMPPRPQQNMGMGVGGMGMTGGMGMGYGGYGVHPGMMPMYGGGYGMAPQPGMGMGPMGYGGMLPTMGGNQPMGSQQKLM